MFSTIDKMIIAGLIIALALNLYVDSAKYREDFLRECTLFINIALRADLKKKRPECDKINKQLIAGAIAYKDAHHKVQNKILKLKGIGR